MSLFGHEGPLGRDLVKVRNLAETGRSPVQDGRQHPTRSRPSQQPSRTAAMQREEPVDFTGRTHGMHHQADIRLGHRRWPERQLYVVLLTFPPRHHV
jgi:hypothetical protein